MKTLKTVTYFNIVAAIVFYAARKHSVISDPDYFMPTSLIVIIFYNWTGVRILMGQKIKWRVIFNILGFVVVLLGVLFMINNIFYWTKVNDFQGGLIFLSVLRFLFSVTLVYQAARMIRLNAQSVQV